MRRARLSGPCRPAIRSPHPARRSAVGLALAGAVALSVAACARAPAAPETPEAAIRPADLAADVAWLADPARGGRGTGTPGGAEAQAWVAERMRALGLAPAGDAGGFLQAFEAPVGARLSGENALRVGGRDLALERDVLPFTFSETGEARGELVWVGHGITAPDLGHDDYAGVDVKGKVVVVAAHFPREDDPASPFRDPSRYAFGEWRYKAMNARDHGAAGFVGVRDDWNHPGGDALEPFHGAASSRAGIVAARATLSALAAAGVDARALAAPGHADGRPHSRALGVEARLAAGVEQERARTANVVGVLPGADPAAGCVVVGAHLDHLGMGGESSLAPGVHAVHPGADDNASGVAALLGVARALAGEARPPRRTVVFAAFAGEELGLLGSAHLVRNPPPRCAPEATQLMVNLDMVGRARGGKLYVQGADTAEGGRARLASLAAAPPALPLTLAFGGDGYGPSDHTSYYAKGVPVVFLFTGAHGDYHRPTDTADKVDPASLAAVARLAYRTARAAADAPERYVVVKVPPPPGAAPGEPGERARGYGAYLGSVPDFEERKEPGVLVSAVRAGSPAEKAGMKAGDVLLQVGATRIVALPDLAYALRSHRAGDVVEVVWRRGAQETRAQVTLAERK